MKRYALFHVSNAGLLTRLRELVALERTTTADIIAHLAEVEDRRLYAEAGYPSMYEYCVRDLGFSDAAAYKRIHVARLARRFPVVLPMLSNGRLNLTSVLLLARHLNEATAGDLIAAAAGKRKSEIELLLAERFPRADVPESVRPLCESARAGAPQTPTSQGTNSEIALSPAAAPDSRAKTIEELTSSVPPLSRELALERVEASRERSRVAPIAPHRFQIQFTIGSAAHAKLRHAQALLGRETAAHGLAHLFEQALDALVTKLEKRRFAATSRPRAATPRRSRNPRHIPAAIKRAVWSRDEGRCTFVAANGTRCDAHAKLEFDHVEPVAKGGQATARNLRLRCRAHNQLEAERAFGAAFMNARRALSGVGPRSKAPAQPTSTGRPAFL